LDAILRFNGLAPRAPANYLGRPPSCKRCDGLLQCICDIEQTQAADRDRLGFASKVPQAGS
jgi:hypothetical protein